MTAFAPRGPESGRQHCLTDIALATDGRDTEAFNGSKVSARGIAKTCGDLYCIEIERLRYNTEICIET
jgi:hypothetical protein